MPNVRFHIQIDGPVCTGDEFVANILIDAPDAAINAAQGTLLYNPAHLSPVAVRYGNSILRYWVQAPSLPVAQGEIPFIGGLPYPGFIGERGPVMSVVFRAEGSNTNTTLSFAQDAQALLNDGKGTPAAAQSQETTLALVDRQAVICGTAPVKKDAFEDTTPPEPFEVVITRTDKAFSGEYFAAFDTVDRETGVDHYEVRESSLYQSTPWLITSSPYRMTTNGGQVLVEVKAVDGAGNIRLSSASQVLEPLRAPLGPETVILVGAALVIAIVIWVLCTRGSRKLR